MTAYAVCLIAETKFGEEIEQYLTAIDDTLEPFGGKFRIHGGPYQQIEVCSLAISSSWNFRTCAVLANGMSRQRTNALNICVPTTPAVP